MDNYEPNKRKVSELKNWDKNPREIDDASLERLKRQIGSLEQYKPLIITKDGTVLGGNMRLKALRELGIEWAWVEVVEAPTDREKLAIALVDNDRAGYYEDQQLAEMVQDMAIDMQDFHVQMGEATPLEFLIKPKEEPVQPDLNTNDDKLQDFLTNPNKQIVLFFMPEEYDQFVSAWDAFKAKHDIEENKEAVKKLLDLYEQNP